MRTVKGTTLKFAIAALLIALLPACAPNSLISQIFNRF